GHAVAVNVCKRARVGVVAAPTAGVGPEGGKLERGGGKVSAWGGERLEDASRAEADDVGHAVAVYVRKRARIGVVVAPAAGVGADGGELERRGCKVPACVGERPVAAGRAEGDDFGPAIPVYVSQLARVGVVAAPTAGHGAEGGKLERGRGEVPACGGERFEDASRAEADDVGHAGAVYVRKRARIGVVAG